MAYIRHDHAAVANPRVPANPNVGESSALFLNWNVNAIKVVLASAAKYVHIAADGYMVIDHHIAEGAAIADVDSRPDTDFGMSKDCSEADMTIRRECLQAHSVVSAAEKDADSAGKQTQELGTPLKNAIVARSQAFDPCEQPKRAS
jgi:hypothetical protein